MRVVSQSEEKLHLLRSPGIRAWSTFIGKKNLNNKVIYRVSRNTSSSNFVDVLSFPLEKLDFGCL